MQVISVLFCRKIGEVGDHVWLRMLGPVQVRDGGGWRSPARASLQILITRLRKVLAGVPGCLIERYGDSYRLAVSPDPAVVGSTVARGSRAR